MSEGIEQLLGEGAPNKGVEQVELKGHTLLLVQFVENEESRTYLDTKTPYEALETLCRLYENYCLQKRGTHITSPLDYELKDLLSWIDQLQDASMMIFNEKAAGYTCHGKAWIKGMLHVYLRKLA